MSCLVSDITIKNEPIVVEAKLAVQPIKVIETQVRSKNLWDVTCGIICSLRDFIKACFTRGYWIDEHPWNNSEPWNNIGKNNTNQ